jgi:hypothetical protein
MRTAFFRLQIESSEVKMARNMGFHKKAVFNHLRGIGLRGKYVVRERVPQASNYSRTLTWNSQFRRADRPYPLACLSVYELGNTQSPRSMANHALLSSFV